MARTCRAYVKSKTLAERAAWDFIAKEGGGLELSVVNPVGVFGPVLGPTTQLRSFWSQRSWTAPCRLPRLFRRRRCPRCRRPAHPAMTDPAAKGERFLAVAGNFMSVLEIAEA